MNYCNCYGVLSVVEACKCIKDEVIEFIEAPSRDEFSDICFGINRLIGAIIRRKYVRVIPYDNIHISKINKRMNNYGCIRSKNQH